MKLPVMILGALVMLAVGGAGGYLFFQNTAEASLSEEELEKVEAKKAEKKKEKEEKKHYEYVELDPLMLPIIDKNGVSQVLSMVVMVETADPVAIEKVEPKLTDAYIQELYGVLNEHAALKGGVIQIEYIKAKLNKVSKKVAGDEVVHDVLLQVVQQRPL
ncbi:MAG: flagellar basal body-associated FliL family protein [Alphaproteobacteria bacterium]